MSDQLMEQHYFTTPVYMVKKLDFLNVVKGVSDRYLEEARSRGGVVVMSGSYVGEPEVAEFGQYVSQTVWNILSAQGYQMSDLVTYFTEMWTQEHSHLSAMETHVHGHGVQMSAFYFLDVPDNSCKLVIHDPRPAKLMVNLHPAQMDQISQASHQIVFTPEPGLMVFVPAWLPHSFTKNFSDKPMTFVHMNLSVSMSPEALQRMNNEKTVEIL